MSVIEPKASTCPHCDFGSDCEYEACAEDRRDPLDPARGLLLGMLLSVPMAAGLLWLFYAMAAAMLRANGG